MKLSLIFVGLFVLLDRLTKFLVLKRLFFFQSPLLKLELSRNQSLFFWPINQEILIILSAVLIVILLVFLIKKGQRSNPLLILALLLIIAGGLSNLYDRLAWGFVVDFLWIFVLPISTFNIADMLITGGCILLAGGTLKKQQKEN